MQNQPKAGKPAWTILKLLEWTTSYFKTNKIDSPRTTAEILLAHILQLNRIDLYLQYDQPVSGNELAHFKVLIKRRINREPAAYILGVKEFWTLDLVVTKDVLIPRPETECLVEAALLIFSENDDSAPGHDPKQILELGTGSGAITIALASQSPEDHFLASDFSIAALKVAKENAKQHNLDAGIDFLSGDLLTCLKDSIQSFDMIISNPPYIRTADLKQLQPEIYRYEPLLALDGHDDGLFYIRQIIRNAHNYLRQKGYLLLEIGYDQKKAVQGIIDDCGIYEKVSFTKDYGGHDRVVQMRKRQRIPA
jgi:release factor glutamine methyltransferase